MYFRLFTVIWLVVGQAYAWNNMGHRLVAQIAIDQLSKGYVKKLSHLNHEMDVVYQPRKLVNSATWLDDIRFYDNQWYTTYHYQDKYFSVDGSPFPDKNEGQASWAIQTSINGLEDKKTIAYNKAMSLRILLHVIGDIHQPLHTLSNVSKTNPQGDSGGNLYRLDNNPIGQSLHKYWDNGGGFLMRDHPIHYREIIEVAHQIEHKYPCQSLPVGKIDFHSWIQESRKIAIEQAYGPLKGSSHIPEGYKGNVQRISQYRIALAGCRLAKVLKHVKIAYNSTAS